MSIADIIQIILSILSLIATVAISVIIYVLDRKREKRSREEALFYDAKSFILDNNNGLDYLPLCIIAASTRACLKNKKCTKRVFSSPFSC